LSDGVNPPGNVCDIQLKDNRAFVYATLAPAGLSGLSLHYGAGTDPYCNITDEADRSLPVFGPVPLGEPKALTPFWRTAEVALFDQPYGRLGLRPPRNLRYRKHTYPADFADSRFLFPRWPKDDTVLVYRLRFSCTEAMKLELLLGYDGPITAWVDGRRVLRDPHGTNPAIADQHALPFSARSGRHEVVVALGNQSGRAWGIWARLARRDVSKAALLAGLKLTLPELRTQ
jgi:sialate O-acetylesterase